MTRTTYSSLADRVVLFVHGAGTPSEVAFDVPYKDYSWMAFLAGAGWLVLMFGRSAVAGYFGLFAAPP